MGDVIYKVLRADEWQQASAETIYDGSTDDRRDGFIHFSTQAQLEGTLNKYYRGEKHVNIFAFSAKDFSADSLRWEPSRGDDLFPHLYGSLNLKQAKEHWTADIPTKGDIDLLFLSEVAQ